jgi:Dolichyl-phosphate-mannose-protein mannosyltransferase
MRVARGYFKTRDGAVALSLVLACGLVLAFFTWRTFVDPPPRDYQLDFGHARWIEHDGWAPCAYFRKTLYVSGNVDRAWLQVAATDRYVLYVNGIVAAKEAFATARPSTIVDIKQLLTPGKNVIAAYVPRIYYPGNAQLIARGFVATQGGAPSEFLSNATWKVANTPDGIVGGLEWFEPLLDDSRWANARETVSGELFSTVQPVNIDPRIFENGPAGFWLGPISSTTLDASFESVETLPLAHGATWLQVAATGSYDVVINGRLAISQPSPKQTKIPFPNPPSLVPVSTALPGKGGVSAFLSALPNTTQPSKSGGSPAVPLLVAYDVSPFMREGANDVCVHVRCELGTPAVLVSGQTELPGKRLKIFSSDGGWRVREQVAGTVSTAHAVVVGPYDMRARGILPQVPALPQSPAGSDLRSVAKALWTLLIVEIFVLVVWLATASWFQRIRGWSPEQSLTCAALLHLPTLVVLLLLWLLCYDVRFRSNWCFQPAFVLAAFLCLLATQLLLFIPSRAKRKGEPSVRQARIPWKILAFSTVILLGFGLRLHDLTYVSLSSDEMAMIRMAEGVRSSGYPHKMRGSVDQILATYELVTYTVAASVTLLGHGEFAYRFHSMLFSTGTVALIAFVGTRMMNWRVGLISALVYACFPPSIVWAHNTFYPSEEQFFSLLTLWLFYEGVSGPELRARYLTFASIAFTLAYFTWEGSGFNLPTLFLAIIVMRWGDYRWMKDWHLWRCSVVISCIVISQLAYRQLTITSYTAVGYSLSDVTTPSLVFRNLLTYNPAYYLNILFFSDINFTLSLLVFGGFLFCWGDRAIRYLVVVLFTLMLCYTNLLPAYAPRYCYNCEVLLILAGVGIFFRIFDRIRSLGGLNVPEGALSLVRRAGAAALVIVFALATNELLIKSYRLSVASLGHPDFYRIGYCSADHRGTGTYVRDHWRAGDGIVAFNPGTFEYYYGGQADYSLNPLLNTKMNYDPGLEDPRYGDKFMGRPLIRSLDEFSDVITRFPRVWVIVPTKSETTVLTPEVANFLDDHAHVVFETYRLQVHLVEGAQRAMATQRSAD